ncbi:PepSY domain-containing protein [Hellea balneolensis]|uniref:PepSY domain-containing protein n=1 Tax=Hellea balneolensis TaxID=287478 RepID=UPI00138ADF8D|nr:PepSY domain-containing protein [Hellea balneolensis]
MTKRDFWKYLTRVHKWAGLILGIQIVIWFASGLFMALFPIDEVRGSHLAEKATWSLTDAKVIPLEIAMTAYDGNLTGASLTSIAGEPAYALIGDKGTQLINARTGEPWEPVGEKAIRLAADKYYKGDGEIAALKRLIETPKEYRRPPPVWQVQYDDRAKTRLYLDAQTAELLAVRTKLWRVYDFMWMLHIMDYDTRDNFNSWWLRLAAFLALLFAISGMMLVAHRVFLRPKPKRKLS